MHKVKPGLMLAALSSAVLVAACGGGGSGPAPVVPAPDISQSEAALVAFVNGVIATTDETGEPIDTNALTLALDDSAEPAAI